MYNEVLRTLNVRVVCKAHRNTRPELRGEEVNETEEKRGEVVVAICDEYWKVKVNTGI